MISLASFQRPICVAGKPLGDEFWAYKMDGESPDSCMREFAGLGTSNCCDYFRRVGGQVVLMEESRLFLQKRALEEKFACLKGKRLGDFVHERIKWENRLKIYGSMLLLCRLVSPLCGESRLREDVQNETRDGQYAFWLIVSGEMRPEDERALDALKRDLTSELRSILSKKVIRDVEVLRPDELADKLSAE